MIQMKNHRNAQGGFIPILIVIVVAAAAAVGGGVYYNNQSQKAKVKVDLQATTTMDINGNATSSARSGGRNLGSIRSLLTLGSNSKCTISAATVDGTISGIVYVSGSSMRGDFSSSMSGSGNVESHMIRNQNDVFVWSGSQGAKMNVSSMASGQAAAGNDGQVSLDQNVEYACESWVKDESRFSVPTSVEFIDISAAIQSQSKLKLPGGIKAEVDVDSSVKAY